MFRSPAPIVLCAFLLTVACASPPSERDVKSSLVRAAGVPANAPGLHVVPIHAESPMEAWTRLADAKGDPNAGESRQLARAFKGGATRRVTFVVGGPHGDLTERLVLNAFGINEGRALPGLTLVLVTPDPPSEELKSAATYARARFVHRVFPE